MAQPNIKDHVNYNLCFLMEEFLTCDILGERIEARTKWPTFCRQLCEYFLLKEKFVISIHVSLMFVLKEFC